MPSTDSSDDADDTAGPEKLYKIVLTPQGPKGPDARTNLPERAFEVQLPWNQAERPFAPQPDLPPRPVSGAVGM